MAQPITWVVVEQKSGGRARLVSKHRSQQEAEAECGRRNSGGMERPFFACILLEPVAQRMGGHQAPIGEAFDQASARIKRIFCNDPEAVEASRIRLAEAILSVATEGNTDVEDLKNRAIVELAQHYSSPAMRK